MIAQLITDGIISKLIDKGLEKAIQLKDRINNDNQTTISVYQNKASLEERLYIHLKSVINWQGETSLAITYISKNTDNLYVDLNYYLTKRNQQILEENPTKVSLEDLFSRNKSIIILGQPGTGKTTSMKALCGKVLYDNNFYPLKFRFPIVVIFREFKSKSLIDHLRVLLGLEINTPSRNYSTDVESKDKKTKDVFGSQKADNHQDKDESFKDFIDSLVIEYLDSLNCLIILDGFDEISRFDQKKSVLSDIRKLSLGLNNSKFIITSRSGDLETTMENTSTFEIAPFDDSQIKNFILNWIGNKEKSDRLLSDIKDSVYYDTTVRPLTLAHLCALYEKYGSIPEKPKSVYRLIVDLLIEKWDLQRNVDRFSSFPSFETDIIKEILINLAYVLSVDFDTKSFDRDTLKRAIKTVSSQHQLPVGDINDLIRELETHSGLLIESASNKFGFPHLSIQEYLTAEFFVKISESSLNKNRVLRIPNAIAIAVTLSPTQTYYFCNLIIQQLPKIGIYEIEFYNTFFQRLYIERPTFISKSIVAVNIYFMISYITDNYIKKRIDHFREAHKVENLPNAMLEFKEKFRFLLNIPFITNSLSHINELYSLSENRHSVYNGILITITRNGKALQDGFNTFKLPSSILLPFWLQEYIEISPKIDE